VDTLPHNFHKIGGNFYGKGQALPLATSEST
jgi:hypothetical protein